MERKPGDGQTGDEPNEKETRAWGKSSFLHLGVCGPGGSGVSPASGASSARRAPAPSISLSPHSGEVEWCTEKRETDRRVSDLGVEEQGLEKAVASAVYGFMKRGFVTP